MKIVHKPVHASHQAYGWGLPVIRHAAVVDHYTNEDPHYLAQAFDALLTLSYLETFLYTYPK
jgi:hypothetical protein